MSSTPNPAIVKVTTPSTINVSDLTSGTVDGSGVFDQLMRGVNAQLDKQFKADRITGSEYAAIYTEAIKQVLATATTVVFEKAKQAYDLTLMDLKVDAARLEIENLKKQGRLTERQTVFTDAQTDLINFDLNIKSPTEAANLTKQGNLLDKQLDVSERTTVIQEAQSAATITGINKQNEILDFDLTTKLPAEVSNLIKQGLVLAKQVDVSERTTVIQEAQSVSTIANTTKQTEILAFQLLNKMPIEVNTLNKQLDVMDSQIAGQVSQNALYDQKTLSERANVDGSVIGTNSLFDKQRTLLTEQQATFVKDGKQKVAKMMIDSWAVRFTEDPAASGFASAGLSDANVAAAVSAVLG